MNLLHPLWVRRVILSELWLVEKILDEQMSGCRWELFTLLALWNSRPRRSPWHGRGTWKMKWQWWYNEKPGDTVQAVIFVQVILWQWWQWWKGPGDTAQAVVLVRIRMLHKLDIRSLQSLHIRHDHQTWPSPWPPLWAAWCAGSGHCHRPPRGSTSKSCFANPQSWASSWWWWWWWWWGSVDGGWKW